MSTYIKHIIVLLFLFVASGIQAQEQETKTDSIRVSLLTCTAGEEIYSLFGHTAIRYEDLRKGVDYVFNYGIFSFKTPNFIWRFVKGETDYQLGINHFDDFKREYAFHGRGIIQQTLNLTLEEKEELYRLLIDNYRPENRIYRYSFFYDNCSTRPRDKIEQVISKQQEQLKYNNPPRKIGRTFRSIVHRHTKGYEWEQFGMDFCIGADADQPIQYYEEMFAPFLLETIFDEAHITDSKGDSRALISEKQVLLEQEEHQVPSKFFTPMRVFLLLFIIVAAATIYGIKKRKSLWGIDLILFTAAGLAGSIIFFLMFFSEHPAVDSNFLIIVFHPLHLLLLPWVLRKERKGRRSIYHTINALVLTLFILLWWAIPQIFNLAVLPLALCLLVRSASNLILTYKKNR
ncbi:DUF4105 domain-containing protein [Bacteroides sp. 224]|uniref:lipoprotein N-acyltransferase Lnb n=1 Tax=Bacteroides sp. 224 TaxID=2302936 RepID=UPI0013D032AA|nr:DUF4105 domain-containing protein [Bacteroides sp. 224]NDV65572.1 DUF4105 domain-containing protein [Bacteroides sp. 224]